jgi:hypothetical protein
VTAEPQPNAAAILDTLNEIKRELAEGRVERYVPPIMVKPIRIVGGDEAPAPAPTARLEPQPAREPPPPPRRSTARRVAFGLLIAGAYVAIFAAAGLFVSSAVRPQGNGSTGIAAMAEHAVGAVAARAHGIVAAWRDGAAPPPAVGEAPLDREAAVPAAPVPAAPAPVVMTPAPPAPVAAASVPDRAPPVAAPPPQAMPPDHDTAMQEASPPDVSVTKPAPAAAPPAVLEAPPVIAEAPPAPAIGSPRAPVIAAPATAVQDLSRRGDQRLSVGDIASARLFYRRAAESGDARAALQLGSTYDPAFLVRLGVQGMRGDVAQAATWYRRARDLGDGAAAQRLQALSAH